MRCENCDGEVKREYQHARRVSDPTWTCTAYDWRAEAMRLRKFYRPIMQAYRMLDAGWDVVVGSATAAELIEAAKEFIAGDVSRALLSDRAPDNKETK